MFNKFRAKEASISIEVSLSVLLASAVLIIALGLFSENLKAMALSSNMTNFFKGNTAKTDNTYMDTNTNRINNRVTVAQVPTGQNTMIVADQGQTIEEIHNAAQQAIIALAQKPQPLTNNADIINLAEQLTILAESGTTAQYQTLGETIPGMSQTYNQLKNTNHIIISTAGIIYYTQVKLTDGTTKNYSWGNSNTNPNYSVNPADPNVSQTAEKANIDAIRTKFKS